MKTYKYRIYKIQDGNCETRWVAYRTLMGVPVFRVCHRQDNEEDARILCVYDAHGRRARNYTIISSKDISV